MQALLRIGALAALACATTAALTASPAAHAAPATPGTILFGRPLLEAGAFNDRPIGSAIYSIRDDGFGERQLTPLTEGVFNVPDDSLEPYLTISTWHGNAFSPSGNYSLFLRVHADGEGGLPFQDGKYFVMNAYGQRMPPLFPGGNDLQPPKDGPSYGYVSWGPADANAIAYANSASNAPVHHACVRLMHPNGTGDHKLWCADDCPPYLSSIQGIRWSGDGKSLLVSVLITDPRHPFPPHRGDLYRIKVATGTATRIQTNIETPEIAGSSDLSYDGHEAVYETNVPQACTSAVPDQIVVCAKNLVTGQRTALLDPDRALIFAGTQVLLTPDGSQVVMEGTDPSSKAAELYLVDTDGTRVRKLTQPCVPLDPAGSREVIWEGVRLSPDGKRLLANCYVETFTPQTGTHGSSRIYIVNLVDGSARYITDGYAYDWHVPAT